MPFQLFLLINIWANFWKNSTDRGVNKSSKIRRTCFVSSNFFSIRMWVFSRWRMDKIWRQNSCLIFNVVPHLNFWSLPFWSIHRWEGKVAHLFLMNPRRFKTWAWDLGKPVILHNFGLFSLKPQGTAEEARMKKVGTVLTTNRCQPQQSIYIPMITLWQAVPSDFLQP